VVVDTLGLFGFAASTPRIDVDFEGRSNYG